MRGNGTSCLQLTLNWFRKKYSKNKLYMYAWDGGDGRGRTEEGHDKANVVKFYQNRKPE